MSKRAVTGVEEANPGVNHCSALRIPPELHVVCVFSAPDTGFSQCPGFLPALYIINMSNTVLRDGLIICPDSRAYRIHVNHLDLVSAASEPTLPSPGCFLESNLRVLLMKSRPIC